MSYPASDSPGGLPRWLLRLASVVIVFHLGTLFFKVLAAPSGPWMSMEGPSMATPPQIAYTLNEQVGRPYLQPLKLTHNYHFTSNRSMMPRAYLEIRLLDENGAVTETRQFPDPRASSLVRYRQELVTRWLIDDQPLMPPPGEFIAAPGQVVQTVPMWDMAENRQLKMTKIAPHLVPRDRPVMRPSDWSLLVIRSYARHLCRTTGAAQVEVVRHSREPIPPMVLFTNDVRTEAFEELVSNYGRMSK